MATVSEYVRRRAEEERKKQQKSQTPQTTQSQSKVSDYVRRRAEAEQKKLAQQSGTGSGLTTGATEQERTWFQKGALEGGVTAKSIFETILGTVRDAKEDLNAGALGMGEKFVDSLAALAPYAAQGMQNAMGGNPLLSPEELQTQQQMLQNNEALMGEFISKDLYDEQALAKQSKDISMLLLEGMGIKDADKTSVLGEKSDALVQSAGQLGATAALTAVGVPAWLVTGSTSLGAEAENALKNGATMNEAVLSGVISAGAEVLTEKLSGGVKFGKMGTLDEGLTKLLARSISSKTGRVLAKMGMDIAGEGAEEVVSQIFSNLGSALYREEDLSKIMFSEEAFEEYLESFIGGAVLGAGGSAVQAVGSKRSGKDAVSGLTANEQKVVDKVYKDRVAAEEKNGKVTQKRKTAIYDKVVADMDKGYISTDTIEEVLGDRNQYDALSKEAKEFDELYNTESGKLSQKQLDRLAELGAKNKQTSYAKAMEAADSEIRKNVEKAVAGDRLAESYRERARKGEAFQADVTSYTGKARQIVQKAVDSGVLNNTNRSHELVDLIANIGADKDVDFDFANNEKLKESGFSIDGGTVNGLYSDKGITVNVESAKALNSVVGHEVTHVLEGSQLYDALAEAVTKYAKSKGEYDSRLKSITELYQQMESYRGEGAEQKIQRELVADLVGEYLFTDKDFVERLSTEDRNVFQKIYDEVKYLCRVATAGTEEARQLEKVKKTFEDAYRKAQKSPTGEGGVRYSLSGKTTPTYEELTRKDPVHIVDVTAGIESGTYADMKDAVHKKAEQAGWYDHPHHNEDTDSMIFLTKESFTHAFSNLRADFGEDTIRAMAHIPEIIQSARLIHVDDPKNPRKAENKVYTFLGAIKGVDGIEPVKLTVKEFDVKNENRIPENIRMFFEKNGMQENYNRLYDAQALEVISIESVKKESDASGKGGEEASRARATSDSEISVADLLGLVKGDAEKYIPKARTPAGVPSLSKNNVKEQGGGWKIMGEEVARKDVPILDQLAEETAAKAKQEKPILDQMAEETAAARRAENDDLPWIEPVFLDEGVETAQPKENAKVEANGEAQADDDRVVTVNEKLEGKKGRLEQELSKNREEMEKIHSHYDEQIAKARAEYDALKDKSTKKAAALSRRIARLERYQADRDAEFGKRINDLQGRIEKVEGELQKDHSKADRLELAYRRIDRQLEIDKQALSEEYRKKRYELSSAVANKSRFIQNGARRLYDEIRNHQTGTRVSSQLGELLDWGFSWSDIKRALLIVEDSPTQKVDWNSGVENAIREVLGREFQNASDEVLDLDRQYRQDMEALEQEAKLSKETARQQEERVTRKTLHNRIIDTIMEAFSQKGKNFDDVLRNAKDLSTFSTVDNTPQRVMEKALGYENGQLLADLTVNKVAQNETDSIRWLNSYTDRKNGILKQLSDKYHIKPDSKESAAAQMYAEGFYVNEKNEIIAYGDAELAADFKDPDVRNHIKGLAGDPMIRQIYDETLEKINESRVRNGYPAIPKLENYFLHFREMDDAFSKLGLPFNPNDIHNKDLPTDLNGVTADLKPGQPYFASAMHRRGKRTSFDMLGGVERYLNSAKNQIYHIDDIQTLRALRNYVAETFGQASGLDNLDMMTDEEAAARIKEVYNSHLSTFAKFLNEEANILAGKTSLIDRGLEGVIGRRGITFLNTVNRQVGSNMVGYNISSAGTNFLPVVQTFAKTNKADFVKALAQTVAGKLGIHKDTFKEDSPVVIRRKGADRFHRTLWQKLGDPGYALMGAVDDISTEIIARTKFNEFTRKGMDPQKAHFETDKWVSKLMGDRSLGQMPQLYNSKMLGLVTKFQLEVRNQLDSQFYDTVQEAKASSAEIEDGLARNARVAAKTASTFFQLAVMQHLFGAGYEAVAGYNPAFDIIDVAVKMLGLDDDEEDEDTALDNIEEGFFTLLEDLPYTSTLTGGRIPISSALPIEELINGTDEYGNEKSRWETAGEALPYYLLPGGWGQIKKSAKGLAMFDEDLPVSGSYTDSGKLRFPVQEDAKSVFQAAIFGQWASKTAQEYFDEKRTPLTQEQIDEFLQVDIPIHDYWEYREGLKGLEKLSEKGDYIASLDLPVEKKNILINNIAKRDEPIDMSTYDQYPNFEEFDYGTKHPGKYAISQAVGGYKTYMGYQEALENIEADKDKDGKTVADSRKEKVLTYINGLDAEYGEKIILYKSEYPGDDRYNYQILDYLNGREDITRAQMVQILTELGFTVHANGTVTW